jgi:single-stranded DNA-binding protein
MLNKNLVILGGQIYNLKEAITKTGKKIAKFTITTWSKKGDKDFPIFHDTVAYGSMAETIINNFKNKDLILIEGTVDQFENSEGKRISTVVVNEFSFVTVKEK